MKIDSLQQYITSRSALLNEKTTLEKRLAEINRALRDNSSSAAPQDKLFATSGVAAAKSAKPLPRIQNPMSLKDAVVKVTRPKPLTKPEILAAIHKVGYRFATNDPLKSLDVILYTKGNFKRANGKFSPAK